MPVSIGPGWSVGAGWSVGTGGGGGGGGGSASGGDCPYTNATYVSGTSYAQPADLITIEGDGFFWASGFYQFSTNLVPLANTNTLVTMTYTNIDNNPATVQFTCGPITYVEGFPINPKLTIQSNTPITGKTGIADERIANNTTITFTW